MTEGLFGLDFGTTNSLVSIVERNQARNLTGDDDRPHPSVVWYRGEEIVVGREARDHMEASETSGSDGFVRSPKMKLRHQGGVHVVGRTVEPTVLVAKVLKHLKDHAAKRDYKLSRAVMTVPVDFGGAQRRALRQAALMAGIEVEQFVHEPAAALYAYIRSQADWRAKCAELENRAVLVFDWGGGTLDLTVCRILGGTILQIASRGNNEIGGDRFDEQLRTYVKNSHAKAHAIEDLAALEQPGAAAKLLTQCELAKINLSSADSYRLIVKDYLRAEGAKRTLSLSLKREELASLTSGLVGQGLKEIDLLLEKAGLERADIALCLATGGMVNMPAIRNGLTERFGGNVPKLTNGDTIIAEGAAWIAHDNLRLMLAKPLEVKVADGGGRGSYLSLVEAGHILQGDPASIPNRRFACTDPRDGVASFEFARPKKVGLLQSGDERDPLGSPLRVAIDPRAWPFQERIECSLLIDRDYIAHVSLKALGTNKTVACEIHDLDFALTLPREDAPTDPDVGDPKRVDNKGNSNAEGARFFSAEKANISLRSNVIEWLGKERWDAVPGDLVRQWQPNFLDKRNTEASALQQAEASYYAPCAYCLRDIHRIQEEGPNDVCRQVNCSEHCEVDSSPNKPGESIEPMGDQQ